MNRRLFATVAIVAAVAARVVSASGPEIYQTPFVDEIRLEEVLGGTFPDRIGHRDVIYPLIMYLHLNGDLNESHAHMFRSAWQERDRRRSSYSNGYRLWESSDRFWKALGREGQERSPRFSTEKSVFREMISESADGTSRRRIVRRSVVNCQKDAFDTARKTLSARRRQYGRGSVELTRWVEAQAKVFALCSGESSFDPPAQPGPDWLPLERHDRHYQIAAAYFYNGQYLEAASRFDAIARTPDSPWRALSRYLVPRSYVREATINENEREYHLRLALAAFRDLAGDRAYVAEFPSVPGQIFRIEALLDPGATRRRLERQIVEAPDDTSFEDLRDYLYLARPPELPFGEAATEYEHWRWYASDQKSAAIAVARWRTERSLAWLYVALAQAGPDLDSTTHDEILRAAEALSPDTPGYVNTLIHRVRILGLQGQADDGLRLAEDAEHFGLSRSEVNRVRLAAAEISTNWQDYFRLASLRPIALPWTDGFARGLPRRFNRIASDTTLFEPVATRVLNHHFTATMILDILDSPGLSDYQRGRMAIAGWTKAMLADDVSAALKLSPHIRRHVPVLDPELALFEESPDKRFEAARIIFDYPAISPWMLPGIGRIQSRYDGTRLETRPMPDYVADGWSGYNWWCTAYGPHADDARRRADDTTRGARFAHYSEDDLANIRKVTDALATAATTAFGPHVIRYARENPGDPRVPRTLHRLVFATRHACYTAPGDISRAAFVLLHKHFPDSDWAKKTPYWYDGQI